MTTTSLPATVQCGRCQHLVPNDFRVATTLSGKVCESCQGVVTLEIVSEIHRFQCTPPVRRFRDLFRRPTR